MNSLKNELCELHQFLTYFGAKNRAAHVAAHVPPAFRLRSAHVAAYVAADVCSPELPESDFSDPSHIIAYPQNIAPQKRSWRFL